MRTKIKYMACAIAATLTAAAAGYAAQLPQDHEYQVVLRNYMATLTAADFDHGVTEAMSTPEPRPDQEWRYRSFLYARMNQPLMGSKRGTPIISAPPHLFTLSDIEGGAAVRFPPFSPEALISLAQWDYEGNPYHGNRGLKMRAFATSALQLIMVDNWMDKHPALLRADWHAYQLVYIGSGYHGFQDLLPEPARDAFREGVRRLAERLLAMGIRGDEPNMDLIMTTAFWYAIQIVDEPEFNERFTDFIRKMFTDPKYFHPAGFWVERGGLELGFAGMGNNFAIWTALASRWPFAIDSIDRIYRLQAHLTLPEPDGSLTGPAHFNTRLGSSAHQGQWDWNSGRDYAASVITDEAMHLVHPMRMDHPTQAFRDVLGTDPEEMLARAAPMRARGFQNQISENVYGVVDGKTKELDDHEIRSQERWSRSMWYNWHYPMSVNYGYKFYPEGAWAHRHKLVETDSPMLRNPFERGETFVRNFSDAFIVTRQTGYAAIVHTGPVGRQHPDDQNFHFSAPLGFGGGQLSAFWTPETGALWQGRRSGQKWDKPFDLVEQWRLWPIHAVSGETVDGRVFTSARMADPMVTTEMGDNSGTVTASGTLVAFRTAADPLADDPAKARDALYDGPLTGEIAYRRGFDIGADDIRVTTTLTGDGKDRIAELYETLPVFHRNDHRHDGPETGITFLTGTDWVDATPEPLKGVAVIRLQRFEGTVEIRFDRPRTVKLAPQAWEGEFLTRALCRTILVDLLENDGKPGTVSGEKNIAYSIKGL